MIFEFSKLSKKMLIGSIVAGLIYGVLGEFIFKGLSEVIPSPVLTLIYFTGLFLFLGAALYIIGKLVYSRHKFKVLKKVWVYSFIGILLSSLLLEFVYDLIQQRKKEVVYNSYLFVIDNSGSMNGSDPYGLRYKAIETLLKDKPADFEFGVISFSDNAEVVREMGPISKGIQLGEPINYGGTQMLHTMKYIAEEIDNGNIKADKNTKIVLLSDGEPTDVRFKSTMMKGLKYYVKHGITVSTVGLLYADDDFMTMIADKTGGVYVRCDDVTKLQVALEQATEATKYYRNLLGYRDGSILNILLGIMRILFVGALGLIIAVEKTAICDMFLDSKTVWVTSSVCGILAGICIELGMNAIGINPLVMRMITCVLLSCTFLNEDGLHEGTGMQDVKITADVWG